MQLNLYQIPSHCLYFKYLQQILLENKRRKYIEIYYKRIEYNKKLNEYLKNHITQRQIFDCSTSSDTSESFVSIGTKDSDWIDMKKLL